MLCASMRNPSTPYELRTHELAIHSLFVRWIVWAREAGHSSSMCASGSASPPGHERVMAIEMTSIYQTYSVDTYHPPHALIQPLSEDPRIKFGSEFHEVVVLCG